MWHFRIPRDKDVNPCVEGDAGFLGASNSLSALDCVEISNTI